jgi:hypothetical protein
MAAPADTLPRVDADQAWRWAASGLLQAIGSAVPPRSRWVPRPGFDWMIRPVAGAFRSPQPRRGLAGTGRFAAKGANESFSLAAEAPLAYKAHG